MPTSPTITSWSAPATVGIDLVAVTCAVLILRRRYPWRYVFGGVSAAPVAPAGRPGICVKPVIVLGNPSVARISSAVESCTGWLGRYEYSPCSAMPYGPAELKLTP